jgi:hypothetical protein
MGQLDLEVVLDPVVPSYAHIFVFVCFALQDALNVLMTQSVPNGLEARTSGMWWNFVWFVCERICSKRTTALGPSFQAYVDMIGALAATCRPALFESHVTVEQRAHRIFQVPTPPLLHGVRSICGELLKRPCEFAASVHPSQLERFAMVVIRRSPRYAFLLLSCISCFRKPVFGVTVQALWRRFLSLVQ